MIVETLVLAKGLYDIHETKNNKQRATRINSEAMETIVESKSNIKQQFISTENNLIKLANRRKAIFSTTFQLFLKVMEPLKKGELSKTDMVLMETLQGKVEEYSHLAEQTGISKTSLSSTEAITSYLLFGMPGYLRKRSELAVNQSYVLRRGAETFEKHATIVIDYMKYIEVQCVLMSELTMKFNILLIECLNTFQEIVKEKGTKKFLYTDHDRELMKLCFNLADAIKQITDPAILKDDEITKEFEHAIAFGQQHLKVFNDMVAVQRSNLQQYKLR